MSDDICYPELERFAYSFQNGELNLGRRIYIGVKNISFDQPTEEGVIMGTRAWPLMRTQGSMGLGEGTVEFSEEGARVKLIDALGNGYRDKIWGAKWKLKATGRPVVTVACHSCRLLSNPIDHEEGTDGLGGEITFSFMYFTINGKAPHLGMPSPTR